MSSLRKMKFTLFGLLLAALLTVSTVIMGVAQDVSATEEPHPMSEEALMAFVEKFDLIFDGPNLDVIDEIFAPDYVGHLPLAPELDREGLKAFIGSFYPAISDLTQEVNEVIISEDRLVLRVTYTGTHDGSLFGIPATGTSVTMNGMGIFRFDENGLVAENWSVIDIVGLLAQIGAFPPAA